MMKMFLKVCAKEREREREKDLKLTLNMKIDKKWEKIEIWGHAATTFESQNLSIGNFLWKWAALRWKSARNTSFRC